MATAPDRAPAASGDSPIEPARPPDVTGSGGPTIGASKIPPEVWRIVGVIVLGAFMANLDTALVNVGLDTISRDLDASLAATQWISSGYLLGLAAVLPLGGWLGRRVGVGRLWLWAAAAFAATSALCALPQSIGLLIALRVLQGLAGGLLIPAGQTLLGQAAGPARMGRVMSTAGIAVVLAPALGPTVGGLLIAHLAWQWLFLINIPVGVLSFVLGLRILPRGTGGEAGPLDVLGLLLVVSGLPLLVYGITEAGDRGTLSATPVWTTLAGGVVALALFVWRCLRTPAPLLNLRLYTNRVYSAAAVTSLFGGAALFGGLILLPLYFQLLHGESVVDTGLLLLGQGLGTALMMPIAGRLTDRFGGGVVATIGMIVTAASTVPLIFTDAGSNMIAVQAILVIRGFGTGLALIPAVSAAFATVRRDQIPDATAQVNILQRVGGSIGGALLVVILSRSLDGRSGDASADAFATTFWWLTSISLIALVAAVALLLAHRRVIQAGVGQVLERPASA